MVVVVVGAGRGVVVVVVGGGAGAVVVVVGGGPVEVGAEPEEPLATPPGPKSLRNGLYEFGCCFGLSVIAWSSK